MDAEDVKNRFQDILPPDSAKNVTEINKQNRKMIVNDPIEPSQTQQSIIKPKNLYPLEIDRETTVDPMLTKPDQDANTVQTPGHMDEPSESRENIYKVNQPSLNTETAKTDTQTIPVSPEPTTIGNEDPSTPTEVSPTEPLEAETIAKDNVVDTDTETGTAGLPDPATRAANAIKDQMQEPKIYDTNTYHVPINETTHSHGGVKSALVFGAIFAVVVVGGLIFVLSIFS